VYKGDVIAGNSVTVDSIVSVGAYPQLRVRTMLANCRSQQSVVNCLLRTLEQESNSIRRMTCVIDPFVS
jgi:hypothetical protein